MWYASIELNAIFRQVLDRAQLPDVLKFNVDKESNRVHPGDQLQTDYIVLMHMMMMMHMTREQVRKQLRRILEPLSTHPRYQITKQGRTYCKKQVLCNKLAQMVGLNAQNPLHEN